MEITLLRHETICKWFVRQSLNVNTVNQIISEQIVSRQDLGEETNTCLSKGWKKNQWVLLTAPIWPLILVLSGSRRVIQTKAMYTYRHHFSGTGKEISRRYPDPQRSPPGPGCTPTCCSMLVAHPLHLGQEKVAGPLLAQWSQDLDPYSSGCSYSPWDAPGRAGQPPTQWPAHCCAPSGSPWCSLAWLGDGIAFRGEVDRSKEIRACSTDGTENGWRLPGGELCGLVYLWREIAFNQTSYHY